MSKLKISDLTPDDKNYNKGTQFGNSLIEKSLRKFGAGRSILLDKNNRIIAGNKTIENAYTIGLDDVLVVETTGNQIVAVKRMDIDLDSKIGRELALADNASAKANIDWDYENIQQDWEIAEQEQWGIDNSAFEDNLSNNQDYGNLGQLSLLDNYLNSEIKRMFLVYDNETFENVVKWFEQKQNELSCEDNSQVILKLIENEKFRIDKN
jgi:hypothetical protein